MPSIVDIAVDPADPSVWYVAVGSGGVWKTENAGTTWTPLFDKQASYSIGCVTIDPSNRNVIWVGAGENVGGRHVAHRLEVLVGDGWAQPLRDHRDRLQVHRIADGVGVQVCVGLGRVAERVHARRGKAASLVEVAVFHLRPFMISRQET